MRFAQPSPSAAVIEALGQGYAPLAGVQGEAELITWANQIVAGYVSPVFPVNAYTSWQAYVVNNAVASANLITTTPNCMGFQVTWFADAAGTMPIWVEKFATVAVAELKSTIATGDKHGPVIISDRMHGPYMQVATGVAAGVCTTFSGFLYASTESLDQVRVREIPTGAFTGQGVDNTLLSVGNAKVGATLGANSSAAFVPALGSGAASYSRVVSGTAGNFFNEFHLPVNNAQMFYNDIDAPASGTSQFQMDFYIPRTPLWLIASNVGTASMAVSLAIIMEET